MEQKQKLIALLVAVGILAGAGIGYVWFANRNISQEVAYQIQSKLNDATVASTGSVIVTAGGPIAYVSAMEGNARLNRKGNESLVTKDAVIESGDSLSSDTGATVEIIFADNSFLRLEENSKLVLSSANAVSLENGGLWARILKPLQDTSVFTISASDLSAGVRGTAVYFKKSQKITKIQVVDTTTESGAAVEVTAKTASGILREGLENEESLTIGENDLEKVKLNMDQFLQDENMRDNLKLDILLMNRLMNEATTGSGTAPILRNPIDFNQSQKIRREIFASLPKNNELNKFFISTTIEDEARQLGIFSRSFSGSRQWLTDEEQVQLLVEFTANDMELTQYKKDLKKMRETVSSFTDDAQKEQYQNDVNRLEAKIRDFDENWAKKERQRIEAAKAEAEAQQAQVDRLEGDETASGSLTGTGSGIPVDSGTGSTSPLLPGVPNVPKNPTLPGVPNVPKKPVVPVVPPVSKPPVGTVSGPALPRPRPPVTPIVPRIVSGSALPR